jgi:prohibitin 2
MSEQQEAFKKFVQQLQRAGSGGGGFSGGPRGFMTGSGLLLALIAGGFALNASLFNGTSSLPYPASKTLRGLTIVPVDGGHRAIKYTR